MFHTIVAVIAEQDQAKARVLAQNLADAICRDYDNGRFGLTLYSGTVSVPNVTVVGDTEDAAA